MDSLKPKKRTIPLPLSLFIVCTILFLIFPLTLPQFRTLLLPPCGHIVLISAARHGSSWFLDSAEGCTSGASFEPLNRASELWNRGMNGPVRELTPEQAGDYVEQMHGIKIFPLAYFKNISGLAEFFEHVKKRKVPVFLLTRRLEDSYASYKAAVESAVWNVNSVALVDRLHASVSVAEGEGFQYAQRITTYFTGVRKMLKEQGMTWDEFDYDDVVTRRIIVGERNQCSIRSCNM